MNVNQGIGTWIERRASAAPNRIALIFGDSARTYGDLATRVRHLAHGLQALGVTRGDRVAWLGPNHPAFLEVLFASANIGAVVAPINHLVEHPVIQTMYDDVQPRVVFHHIRLSDVSLKAATAVIVAVGSDNAPHDPYEQLIAASSDLPIEAAVGPRDLCLLPFTSGTTAAPKGIMLSHGNLTWNVINCLAAIGFRADDVTIAVTPFFRAGGIGVSVLPVLARGGTVVIPRKADPDTFFDLVERHRATVAFGSPGFLEGLTHSPRWRGADLASLRVFVTGGAPVSERVLAVCHERDVNLLQGYGLSEAGPVVSVLDRSNAVRKPGSAGRPVPFVDVRIGPLDGTQGAEGEVGELFVRGPNVMAGYWRRPDATQRALDDHGWLRTGDAARLDRDGFLFIVGRVEDAFVSAGTLVHPAEVERVLLRHPSVAEACVIGKDGDVIAYVVLERGVATTPDGELHALCRAHLPVHARPAAIVHVAALPKNAAGKLLRQVVRQWKSPSVLFH